ncbi:MAG TPA: carotenoid oxygenase family protein [Thermoanaerobaculia bacterium]|nr:carotenoid oxygenase family protein [Thermoanaerobaculia bacterium]
MSAAADFAPGLERALAPSPGELEDAELAVEGELPGFLRGLWVANGPAHFRAQGDLRDRHWLDGDGMVVAVRFGKDASRAPRAHARYVETIKRRDEREAGAPLYRAFGTAFPGDRMIRGLALASPANVSVVPWQGRLVASGEQGLPYDLDPETLATRGEYTFGGKLNPVSPLAAHPKLDPHTGELIHFGASFAGAQPSVTLYRFAPDGELSMRRRIPLDRPAVLHDFAVSERFCTFHLSPYVVDVGPLLAEGRCLQDCLVEREELGSRLLVASRATGEEVASIPLSGGYCLHLASAWDDGDRLTVDLLELDRPAYEQYHPLPDLFADVAPGRPVRLLLDLAAGRIVRRREVEYAEAPDFPALDPRRFARPADDLWMLGVSATGQPGRKFFDRLVHADWRQSGPPRDVWTAPAGVYLAGEPVVVPDPEAEREGALLVPLFDAEKRASTLALFDAWNVAAGPRARLSFPSPIHLCFHATFLPAD